MTATVLLILGLAGATLIAAGLWLALGLARVLLALLALLVVYLACYAGLRGAGAIAIIPAAPGQPRAVRLAGPGWLGGVLGPLFAPCLAAEDRLRRDAP